MSMRRADPQAVSGAQADALSGTVAQWIAKAEEGAAFDAVGRLAHSRTRARFDGRQLVLGHWCGAAAVALVELRKGLDGEWRARLAPCEMSRCGLAGKEARALADLEEAFEALPPSDPCGLAERIFWPS